jgi:predicted DNA binding CopG/RHH family protein
MGAPQGRLLGIVLQFLIRFSPGGATAKQLIAIRIDPRLLASLRRMATRMGKPYQTLIHELLEKAAGHAA